MRRIVFALAWVVAAALLARFARDFTAAFWPMGGAKRALVPAFWALVVATLAVAAGNISASLRQAETHQGTGPLDGVLRFSVPAAFLASSLGCSGLSTAGCSPFCTFVRWAGIPLLAAAILVPWRGRRLPAHLVLAFAAIALAPHCICNNPANAWWVARFGASPMCYAWAFAAALVALSAVSSGTRPPLPSLLVNGAILGGSLAFFAGHHFGGYPW